MNQIIPPLQQTSNLIYTTSAAIVDCYTFSKVFLASSMASTSCIPSELVMMISTPFGKYCLKVSASLATSLTDLESTSLIAVNLFLSVPNFWNISCTMSLTLFRLFGALEDDRLIIKPMSISP